MTAAAGVARGLEALRWSYLGHGVRALSQFLVGVALARLLGPEAFGTVAMAGLVIGAGALVADLGLGVVVVQRQALSACDVRWAFTMQVVSGALLTAAGVAAAGPLSAWFGAPAAAPVFRAMAAMFLLQSFGLVPLALMRRHLDFRGAQLVGVASYLGGYLGVGLPLALLGHGAWSLAWAQLVQAALSSALALRGWRLEPRPLFRSPSHGLAAFGVRVIGANLASWLLANADGVVVGRALGAAALGTYGRAMAVVLQPLTALTTSLQGVLFAAASRAQHDRPRLKAAWLGATSAVAALCLPVFATVAAVPEAVVAGIYGPAWLAAAPVLTPLALAMPAMGIMSLAGPVVTAAGRVGLELRASLLTLLVLAVALWLAGAGPLVAVAWAVVAAQVLRAALMVAAVRPVVGATWGEVAAALRWPAAFGLLTAGVTALLDAGLTGAAPPARLAADVAAAAAALLSCLRWLGRRALLGAHGDLLRAGEGLPPLVRRWVAP